MKCYNVTIKYGENSDISYLVFCETQEEAISKCYKHNENFLRDYPENKVFAREVTSGEVYINTYIIY